MKLKLLIINIFYIIGDAFLLSEYNPKITKFHVILTKESLSYDYRNF